MGEERLDYFCVILSPIYFIKKVKIFTILASFYTVHADTKNPKETILLFLYFISFKNESENFTNTTLFMDPTDQENKKKRKNKKHKFTVSSLH